MRNISFALTTPQFLDGHKSVTRRLGWRTLKAGDLLTVVRKGQGLKRGEKVDLIGVIRVLDVRREPLLRMIEAADYGRRECEREGFSLPHRLGWPENFVAFFCAANRCKPDTVVHRIEFERLYGERLELWVAGGAIATG